MDKAQILGTALDLEWKGYTFYTKAEEKTENETGKKMFHQLAKEEKEHIEKLKDMFKGFYPEKSGKNIPFFKGEVSEYSGEVDAIKTGIDMEKKSIEFYSEWGKGEFQELFDALIEFEKTHLDLLQAELDYVQRTGYWFDYFESSLED
ncbi:MAG: ferritin family protein [Candidatus Methanofastidiosia archaeon]|jgi:rubrerythrin